VLNLLGFLAVGYSSSVTFQTHKF